MSASVTSVLSSLFSYQTQSSEHLDSQKISPITEFGTSGLSENITNHRVRNIWTLRKYHQSQSSEHLDSQKISPITEFGTSGLSENITNHRVRNIWTLRKYHQSQSSEHLDSQKISPITKSLILLSSLL
ncbi:hypothetical protein RRG08_061114 [Elysia crispata]|uniref:Uncharacterized protein n=1 Tax=Elysia crispata TaxID=231223 RepID=A0AAE0XT74_9GAST|nr:hypothetical protein RRG08_061114 [Elysia crispata]